jgi:hypothetical protein
MLDRLICKFISKSWSELLDWQNDEAKNWINSDRNDLEPEYDRSCSEPAIAIENLSDG